MNAANHMNRANRVSAAVLASIRERCQKATPGPWKWTEHEWNDAKYFRPQRSGAGPRSKRSPRKGRSIRDSWLLFHQGPFRSGPLSDVENLSIKEIVDGHLADEYEFCNVFRLRWSDIRGEHFSGGPLDEDQEFIAAARSDVPLLLNALEAAYAEIDRLKAAKGAAPGE